MRLVSNDNSLDANRKSYVICDNILVLATEDNSIFQELLVQASEALIELGQFLSVQKNLLHELVVDYYLARYYKKDIAPIKDWISHHSKQIYIRNKYRLAS